MSLPVRNKSSGALNAKHIRVVFEMSSTVTRQHLLGSDPTPDAQIL